MSYNSVGARCEVQVLGSDVTAPRAARLLSQVGFVPSSKRAPHGTARSGPREWLYTSTTESLECP
ncbi:hypothetical protein J6590_000239 [Homalodisca vitripennis]|nr:hypothetical protein J6590_000239 [Homalodisca vitripennis]